MATTPRKTFPELQALSTPLVDSDVVAVYRTPGPAKRTTASVLKTYAQTGVQPLDADLTAIAALTSAADKMPYATGAQTWALADLTSFARSLLATASNNAFLTALGNIAGTFVNFLQAGTGAVTRDQQDRNRDTISVFDYMTTAQKADVRAGTLAEDVTAAIQAAINYAHSLSLGNISVPYDTIRKGGATVFFPAGAYKTTATIVLKENVTLVGAGQFSTIISSAYDGILIRNQTPLFYDAFGMGIKNMTIQGDRTKTAQIGIGLLRDWHGVYENISIVECGSHGFRLYQCIGTIFRSPEVLECVGNGILLSDGINTWETPTDSNLPSNNISFYDPHIYGCDAAGIRLERIGTGIGVMGCQFFGGSSEYNYQSSSAGTGYNIELIDTNSPIPNVFYSLWCEDDNVLAHVLINVTGAQEVVKFVNFKHFGSGAAAWPQKAIICQQGFLDLDSPVGSGTSYRTYLGTNTPFQLTKASGIIRLTNPRGSGRLRTDYWVADETGATTGLSNNLYQTTDGVWRGNQQRVYSPTDEAGPQWLRDGDAFAYLGTAPFFKALEFGGGAAAADVAMARTGTRTVGLVDNNFSGLARFFDSGSQWDGNHILMGAYHLWVDSTGDLRIKSGAPASDTDGTVVGTQT